MRLSSQRESETKKRKPKENRKFLTCPPHPTTSIIKYQKLLEIEKEIVREVARGDKPYLRKSTDRKAQISPLNWTNAFLICALWSVDFLR